MTADSEVGDLLQRVREAGVRLEARGDRLAWSAPEGVMTPELTAALRAAKPRLLAALREEAAGWLPLAPVQEHLYLMERMRPGRHDLNVPAGMWLDGELNVPALRRALDDLVARHDALRLAFAVRADRPVQQVRLVGAVPLTQIEVDETEALRAAVQEARRPFRLDCPPTVRACVMNTGRRYLVVITFHHLTCDEASLRLALRDLARLYGVRLAGQTPRLDPPPRQYSDYALSARGPADDDGGASFWQKYLAGLARIAGAREAATASRPPRSHAADVTAPASAVAAMRTLAVGERTTLLAVVLAGYVAMLSRGLRSDDVVVGLPWEARPPEYAVTMGTFVNTVPVRVRVPAAGSFRDVVRATRLALLPALSHAHVPYRRIADGARAVGVRGDLSDGWLVLRRPEYLTLQGVDVRRIELEPAVARHDLKLDLAAGPDTLSGMLLGRTPHWPAALVDSSAAWLTRLLERGAAQPDLPMTALSSRVEDDVSRRLDELAALHTEHLRRDLRSARRRGTSA